MNKDALKTLYRHDFGSFARFAFTILNPQATYQDNWHLQALAEVLAKAERGQVKRIIINMPPRMMKSHFSSVALPAWILGRNPTRKVLCLHGGHALAGGLHDSCEKLMASPRYRALFGHTVVKAQGRKLVTAHGGYRLTLPILGHLAGLGADYTIIDDPISPLEAQNDTDRSQVNQQFDQNIIQRLNHKKVGVVIVVMQRLHEHDLSGYLLAKEQGWEHFNMPAIAFQDEEWALPYGRIHKRAKGEVLHKGRESREQLLTLLDEIGGYAFAYQYLQGLYKPRFGTAGKGAIWLTPQREGVFWNARTDKHDPHGFYIFSESDLIRAKIFEEGEDPCPETMRHRLTQEEFELMYKFHLEKKV